MAFLCQTRSLICTGSFFSFHLFFHLLSAISAFFQFNVYHTFPPLNGIIIPTRCLSQLNLVIDIYLKCASENVRNFKGGNYAVRVLLCSLESHSEWRYSTSVGEGGSSGVVSSGIFKSTESRRRSSINYYFRLFKLGEDRKVGGTQKRE